MKKLLLIIFSLTFLCWFSFAQEVPDNNSKNEFMQGSHTLHLGIGFPNKFKTELKVIEELGQTVNIEELNNLGGKKVSPQVNIGYEYGLSDEVGIGLYLGYFNGESSSFSGTASLIDQALCDLFGICPQERFNYNYRYHVYSIGGRLAVHQKIIDGLDTYASTYAGYNFHSKKSDSSIGTLITHSLDVPPFSYFVNGGLQFHVSDEWGIYAEAGYGLTIFNIGLSYFAK